MTEERANKYKWDEAWGLLDQDGNQELQLSGGTKKFREHCGKLLVNALNGMDEERAREILGSAIKSDYSLRGHSPFFRWCRGESTIILDDNTFTADELEAIAFWMRRNAT